MKGPGSRKRKSKPKRRASIFEDRVGVYVDSPLMTHRVSLKRQLFARIQGNYGTYRTWARSDGRAPDGGCTCPSEGWPRKHVAALERTWRVNRRSFFDGDGYLATLAHRSKAELIDAIGRLIARGPEGLTALGAKGFDDDEEEDPAAEGDEWR